VHTLTDNKRWHKGGVGRLGKSPKYAQMGNDPPPLDTFTEDQLCYLAFEQPEPTINVETL
jgi:hypothetical protein